MIIKSPVISEKTTALMNQGCYVFYADKRVNKKTVRQEIESTYSVKVVSIRVVNLPAKEKVFRRIKGVRPGRFKVYVRLKKGQVIPGFEIEKPKKEEKSGQDKNEKKEK